MRAMLRAFATGIAVPARLRHFGYLFQDYALFPLLNVRQNIAFGLRHGLRNPPARAISMWRRRSAGRPLRD